MKDIRTIIVEDEAPSRRRIKKLLAEGPRCILLDEAENGTEAIEKIGEHRPDLVLLDIQLKDMTGFEVLQKVSPWFEGLVVFITAYDEYAIRAFEANATDYLLKPFKKERFTQALSKVIYAFDHNQHMSLEGLMDYLKASGIVRFIDVKEGAKTHRVDPTEITYIQAEGYYCHLHSGGDSKLIRVQLKEIGAQLPAYFVRINRSVIINTQKISWVRKLKRSVMVEMLDGEQFMATMNLELLG